MTPAAGFFGKIPSRGDFVRHGLPADFVTALDGWWQRVLPIGRSRLGEGWTDCWMVAPVWRFALPPGCCGAGAAVGLWLPSIDRAGRLFPLTIALVGRNWQDVGSSLQFLDRVEAIGIGAVEEDVEPGALGAAVAHAAALGGDPVAPPAGVSRWWTAGSPLVAASTRELRAMPDGNEFTAMLRDAGES